MMGTLTLLSGHAADDMGVFETDDGQLVAVAVADMPRCVAPQVGLRAEFEVFDDGLGPIARRVLFIIQGVEPPAIAFRKALP